MLMQQPNHYDLSGNVALVAGAMGPLGRACVGLLLAAGAAVVALGHHERAEERAALLASAGAKAERLSFGAADVTDEGQVAAAVADVVARLGRLDILVNAIGGFAMGQPVHELDLATWRAMMDRNATAAFLLSKHAAHPMLERQAGRIIHVSARAAFSGRRNAAAYAVSKRAVVTLVETQAEELRDAHITINAVVPSIMDTPQNRGAMPKADTGRWPSVEAVARVIVFLTSPDAWLINGAAIPVYGLA